MPKEGQKAPAFTLPDKDGKSHALKDYAGQWVLIYFYPKDDTPGCTTEACTLRDAHPEFRKLDAVVLGVSKDSEKSHGKFAEKYGLPFTLLSDPSAETIKAYGAWQMKKFMGREFMGIARMSCLIDPDGKIAKVYPNVKPAEHAKEVLADIDALRS